MMPKRPGPSSPLDSDLEQLGISVVRGLSMDAPHAAASGHQGTAMALAPLAHVLFTRIMSYNAADPKWHDRDRFVLSCGHASILQYAYLYLLGYGLTLDDIKAFRQWGSRTPGHPEQGHTAGVEVTTGPLGQGFANGVGLAIAEARMRAQYGAEVTDHFTYVMCSDGDLAEGVSHEAASLAGHLGLGRLVCIYDLNNVSIDGTTDMWLSDDPVGRFESYGWHTIDLGETADDLDALEAGIRAAMEVEDRPSMLVMRSHIGAPSPTLTDSPSAHGYAFKDDEIAATKAVLGLPAEPFHVPEDVVAMYRTAGTRGGAAQREWEARLEAWDGDRTSLVASLNSGGIDGWADQLPSWEVGDSIATRKASNACLDAVAPALPGLLVGGCDLTGNTGVKLADGIPLTASNPGGTQLYYGVREHGMGSVMNGMAAHGGIIPVGGTFLVFSDYCRPAVRLAALTRSKVIYSFTHDSVGVGEDGPTHQPIEHTAALRSIPDLNVIRPADANEVAGAWATALNHDGPTALILTRQNVPVLEGGSADAVANGGYIVSDPGDAVVTLVAAGSEVSLCVDAAARLGEAGSPARVVSLPSWSLFDAKDAEYQDSVLGSLPRLAVEAGASQGWHKYADDVIGIDRFGASAPGSTVMHELGLNIDNVVATATSLIGDQS